MFELVPPELFLRCSEMVPGSLNDRFAALYTQVTSDTDLRCYHNDTVWFSPSCRHNTTECIPTLVHYATFKIMQLSYFLEMPLAVAVVLPGDNNFAEFHAAVRRGRFLFSYWSPDDTLADRQGRLPVLINLPRQNELEQSRGVFRTGASQITMPNFGWRQLEQVDRRVHFFASKFDMFREDMDAMMVRSMRLKDGGAGADAAAFAVACAWVRNNPALWRHWVPGDCGPGSFLDESLLGCLPCPAGSYCAGDLSGPTACPPASFCPANASRPIPCGAGRSTPAGGATCEDNCTACLGDFVYVPLRGCTSLAASLSAALPAAVALLLLAAKLLARRGGDEVSRMVPRLRRMLRMRGGDGFLLSTERAWRRGRSLVVVQDMHVEAAARLALLREDFDPRHIDALCAALYGREPARRVGAWLLEISRYLLDPCDDPGRLTHYVLPPAPRRPWWRWLTGRVAAGRGAGERSGARPGELGGRPSPWLGFGQAVWKRTVLLWGGPETWEVGVRLGDRSSRARFDFFLNKLSGLEVWREDKGALFRALQEMARGFIHDLGEQCNARFLELLAEEMGPELSRTFVGGLHRGGSGGTGTEAAMKEAPSEAVTRGGDKLTDWPDPEAPSLQQPASL